MGPENARSSRGSYTYLREVSLSASLTTRSPAPLENHERVLCLTFSNVLSLSCRLHSSLRSSLRHHSFCLFVALVDASPSIYYTTVGMWPTVYPRISIPSTREASKVFWTCNCACLLPCWFLYSSIETVYIEQKARKEKWRKNGNAR